MKCKENLMLSYHPNITCIIAASFKIASSDGRLRKWEATYEPTIEKWSFTVGAAGAGAGAGGGARFSLRYSIAEFAVCIKVDSLNSSCFFLLIGGPKFVLVLFLLKGVDSFCICQEEQLSCYSATQLHIIANYKDGKIIIS